MSKNQKRNTRLKIAKLELEVRALRAGLLQTAKRHMSLLSEAQRFIAITGIDPARLGNDRVARLGLQIPHASFCQNPRGVIDYTLADLEEKLCAYVEGFTGQPVPPSKALGKPKVILPSIILPGGG